MPDVKVGKGLIKLLEVSVVDVLKYQSWCPAHRVLWLKFEKVYFDFRSNMIP